MICSMFNEEAYNVSDDSVQVELVIRCLLVKKINKIIEQHKI